MNVAGLYYNVDRWVENATGRYASADPTGLDGGINEYAYGRSNPLTFSDRLGLQAEAGAVELGCNLLRTRNNVGFVAGLLVIVGGAFLSQPCGGGGRECGNCSPPEHAFLQIQVDIFCKSSSSSCNPTQDLVTLMNNRRKNLQCAIARDRINKRCFAGGDEGHQRASAETWRALARCEELLAAATRSFMGGR